MSFFHALTVFLGLLCLIAAMMTLLNTASKYEFRRHTVISTLYFLTLLLVLSLIITSFVGWLLFPQWQWFLLPPFACALLFLAGHLVNSL